MKEDKYIVYRVTRVSLRNVQGQVFSCNDGTYWTNDKRDRRLDKFTLTEARYFAEYGNDLHYEKYEELI